MNDIGYLTDRELSVIREALQEYAGVDHSASLEWDWYVSLTQQEVARDLDIRFMGARRVVA